MTHIPKGFKNTLIGSLILHVILLSAFFIYRTGSKRIFFAPVYTVNLVEPSRAGRKRGARRPAVKKKKAVKKAAVKAKKPPAAKPKKSRERPVAVKKKAKPAENAVSLAEALKKIKKKVREKEESELLRSKIAEIRKKRKYQESAPGRGDIQRGVKEDGDGASSPGSSGLSASEFELKHKAYFTIIRDRINDNWFYPERFNSTGVSVIVSIRIGRGGELLDTWVEKTSGNRQFDVSLMNAVKKSAPFPPLPVDFDGEYLETGLRFCPECEKK